jgi:hypothetical protein
MADRGRCRCRHTVCCEAHDYTCNSGLRSTDWEEDVPNVHHVTDVHPISKIHLAAEIERLYSGGRVEV